MNKHQYLFLAIFPIGNTDPLHLPVRDVEKSLSYYKQYLGFNILSRGNTPYQAVLMQRGQVTMGLEENGGNPEEESCYLAVNDVNALYQELQNKQLDISAMRVDVHEAQTHRVFFLRAPDGLCFCFGQKQKTSEEA